MGIEEKILSKQIELGVFDDATIDFTKGLAELAEDKGYTSLSSKQQAILEPYLSVPCSGATNPGGHNNNCNILLNGEALLDAYELSESSDSLMCENCREEKSFYKHQWEKISRE